MPRVWYIESAREMVSGALAEAQRDELRRHEGFGVAGIWEQVGIRVHLRRKHCLWSRDRG